ncbi:hypothetical protein DL765_005731 [Monosporascus sp. GIB2]|nr:hypothetical protein DL765_005731 [Monosporascus sp. GIB2]
MASSAAAGFLGRSNTSNSNMRGLVQFIADLRNARARDLEEKRINKELANIRQKFKDGNLSGYHKKKYVCKLLYIYILGWNVDFGHLEAVNLISASKYSEKQIGYLAMTLFLHEKHELLHLVVNSIRKDLLDHNELFNCLALHAIANVGGREMGEALSAEVHRLLISPTSKAFVKKKAALTLLRLYRKHPDIIQPQWAERIISLMDDVDLGVALSVTSLVMAVAQDNLDQYMGAYAKAAARLKRIVVDGEYTADYLPEDSHVRGMIRDSLQKILNLAMETNKNVQQNNAQNAVLFEAINLIIHLDTEHALMKQISSRLGRFITSRETNVRYLGLEAMTHLAARAENIDPIKQHQDVILGSLKDRDISVRRKGLDLLYSMCDSTNSGPIVAELLHYLQNADFAIREEMALKIAILTEKYATDIQWYINVSLKLVAIAGDHLSDEVWQRVIQIVTNNEELQVYAAQNTLQHIKLDHCHETLVKIGAYVLGEFGHLIAEEKGSSPIEQFMALSSKLPACSSSTRAMILSSFIKFVNLFPEIKPQLLHVFEIYSHTLDPELQQRACEYLTLASLPSDDLLRTVCDEMPAFPERQSALLSRLHQKHANTSDKRTWVVGGKTANQDTTELSMAKTPGLRRTFSTNGSMNGNGTVNGTLNGTNGHSKDLAGLDLSAAPMEPKLLKTPNLASAAHLSPGWEPGYYKLLLKGDGVLFEDGQLQVGVRSEYRGQMACLILYFANKTPTVVSSFTTTLDLDQSEKPNLSWDIKALPDSSIIQGGQSRQITMFEAKKVFTKSPTIRISYLAGALQALTLKLPLAAHKFMDPADLTADDFFKRWKQIGGAPREAQQIIRLADAKSGAREMTEGFIRKTIQGFRWGILEGVDPNVKNFVGASVLHTSEGGKFGCLMRLEPNYGSQMVRLTIRATDESVPPVLLKLMEERLAAGAPVIPELNEARMENAFWPGCSHTSCLLASKQQYQMQQTTENEVPGGPQSPPSPTSDEERYEPLPVIPVRSVRGDGELHPESTASSSAPVLQTGGRPQMGSRRTSAYHQDLGDWHRESRDLGDQHDGQHNNRHDINHRHKDVHNYSYPNGIRHRQKTAGGEAPVAAATAAGAVFDQAAQHGSRTNSGLAAAPAPPTLPEQHPYQEQGCCNVIKDAIGNREKHHRPPSPPSPFPPIVAAADPASHSDHHHDRHSEAGPGVPLPLTPLDDLLQPHVASPPSTGRRKLFSSRKALFAPASPLKMRAPSSWSGHGGDGNMSVDSSGGGRGGRASERERAAEGKKWWRWKGTEGASSGARGNGNEEVKVLGSVPLSAWKDAHGEAARDAMELSLTQKAELSRKMRSLPYIMFAVIILITVVTIIGGYGSIVGEMNRHTSHGSTGSPSATHGDQIVDSSSSSSVTSVPSSSSTGTKQSSKSETDDAKASTELLTFVGTTSLPGDPQHTYCTPTPPRVDPTTGSPAGSHSIGTQVISDKPTPPTAITMNTVTSTQAPSMARSPSRPTKGYDGPQLAAIAELVAGRARSALKISILHSTVTVTETLVASSLDGTSTSAETKTASCSGSDLMPNTTTSWAAPSETAPAIRYCPFTGRPNIYTLCAPNRASGSHAASETSSSASGMMAANPFGRLKGLWNFPRAGQSASPWSIGAVAASAWNSVLALGGDVGRVGTTNPRRDRGRVVAAGAETDEAYREGIGGEAGNCNCTDTAEIADLRSRLDFALEIVRSQQQLLDSQHAMIAQHKESLEGSMKLLRGLRRERDREGRLFT